MVVWSCRYETLIALLESNELGTVSEFNVFLAAMRWVDADKAREQLLDEVLGLIRFPTMDYEELGLVGKHPTAAGAPVLKVGSFDQAPFPHPCLPHPIPPPLPPNLRGPSSLNGKDPIAARASILKVDCIAQPPSCHCTTPSPH